MARDDLIFTFLYPFFGFVEELGLLWSRLCWDIWLDTIYDFLCSYDFSRWRSSKDIHVYEDILLLVQGTYECQIAQRNEIQHFDLFGHLKSINLTVWRAMSEG